MNWRPELVALDIDGTAVDRQGRLSHDVRAAVARVVEAGTPVVLATGRAWLDARPVFEQLNLPQGPVVCSNGAVSVEFPPLQVNQLATFSPAPVIADMHELAPTACIAVEDVGQGFRLNRLFPRGELNGRMTVESIAELSSRPVTRVIIRDPQARESDFIGLAERLGMHGVSYAVGWSAWLDIAPQGVTKATALQGVCEQLGIDPARTLAIGDGRNDIEMLEWAGRGVALGDAPWQVQASADDVCANFEDGGTATELNRWFAFGADREAVRRSA